MSLPQSSRKNKQRLCVLTDAWKPVWGGGQEHIWQIYSNLAKQGYQIDIVVPNLITSEKNFPKLENYGNLRVVRIGPEFIFPNIVGRLSFVIATFIYTFLHLYDLYHSHSPSTSLCLPVLKLFGKKIAYTVHGKAQKALGAGILNIVGPFIGNIIVYLAPYDILFSAAASSIEKKVLAKKLIITGNGVNIEEFDRVNLKKGPTKIHILWVGRFDPVKGLNLLLEAFAKQKNKNSNIVLTLVGDGPEKKSILKQIKDLKIEQSVKLPGYLFGKELINRYKTSDIFILPSLSEGFPLVLVEALAAKVPVVASDVGDVKAFIKSSGAGLIIKAGSVEEINAGIERMLLAKRSWKIMGSDGHDFVEKNYTWEVISKKVADAYSDLFI